MYDSQKRQLRFHNLRYLNDLEHKLAYKKKTPQGRNIEGLTLH